MCLQPQWATQVGRPSTIQKRCQALETMKHLLFISTRKAVLWQSSIVWLSVGLEKTREKTKINRIHPESDCITLMQANRTSGLESQLQLPDECPFPIINLDKNRNLWQKEHQGFVTGLTPHCKFVEYQRAQSHRMVSSSSQRPIDKENQKGWSFSQEKRLISSANGLPGPGQYRIRPSFGQYPGTERDPHL